MSEQLYKCDGGKRCRVAPQDCPCRPPHSHVGQIHEEDFACPFLNHGRNHDFKPQGKPILVRCIPCDKRGRKLK